jgi:protein-disulfide isomerase
MKEFVVAHFNRYGDYKKGYTMGHAVRALHASGNGAMEGRFIEAMKSPEIEKALADHVAVTAAFKIDATPTFYIAGRRLVGIPQIQPQLLIETIVASEISRAAAGR